MIQALPAILKNDPDVYYLIVGTGTHQDSLKAEAEKAGINDRVIFAGMRKDIPRLLAASDIFVLPTLTEALPTVLAEAMASHLPIIATSVGGVPEMVENGQNGLLVEPEKPDVLSEACIHLLTSPEERHTMGENGWKVVSNKFNIQNQVENLKLVYLNQLHAYEK
jgi:glycosyltransferase involved in cell wall biosynthesis